MLLNNLYYIVNSFRLILDLRSGPFLLAFRLEFCTDQGNNKLIKSITITDNG